VSNAGDHDVLHLYVESRNSAKEHVVEAIRRAFHITPQVTLLPRGTIARDFEAAVKAPRFVDKRG
jgi:phenylacetate-CoA ligase